MKAKPPIIALRALTLCLVLAPPLQAAPLVGRPAPALVVSDIAGRTLDLQAMRGRVVVVALWATWCPDCRAELKMLGEFADRYRSDGVEVIGLSVDGRHERGAVRKIASGLAYPVAMLADAAGSGFDSPPAVPETLVIDRAGIVRAVLGAEQAPIREEALAALVAPLLRTGAPSPPARPIADALIRTPPAA